MGINRVVTNTISRPYLCYRCITESLCRAEGLACAECSNRAGSGGDVRILRMPQQPESSSPQLAANPAPLSGSAEGSVSNSAPRTTQRPLPLSSLPPALLAARLDDPKGSKTPQRLPRWLVRSELFLRVVLQVYFGLFICYAPWSGQVLTSLPWSRVLWEQNPLFDHFATLGTVAGNGAVRGVVSGLGLLILLFAFQNVVQHWDD